MLTIALALAAAVPGSAAGARPLCDLACLGQVEAIADEAAALAASVPQQDQRNLALEAVSRNLGRFGFERQAVAAARAVSGETRDEIVQESLAGWPRMIGRNEGGTPPDPCDRTEWILDGPGRSSGGRSGFEDRVRRCILDRDTHWAGPRPRAQVDALFAALSDGSTRAELLYYIAVNFQDDASALNWAAAEVPRLEPLLDPEKRDRLARFLRRPDILYRRGLPDEAIAAAGRSVDPYEIAPVIGFLIRDRRAADAAALLEPLSRIRHRFGPGGCGDWFGPSGVLQRIAEGRVLEGGDAGLREFLELLPRTAAFRARCPNGIPDESAPDLLLRAGRIDEAIRRAEATGDSLAHASFLGTVGAAALLNGRPEAASPFPICAYDAFPAGPYARPGEAAALRDWNRFAYAATSLVEGLAAVGEVDKAHELAGRFPNRAWRAVALSYLAAGARRIPSYEAPGPQFASDRLRWAPER